MASFLIKFWPNGRESSLLYAFKLKNLCILVSTLLHLSKNIRFISANDYQIETGPSFRFHGRTKPDEQHFF